MYIYKYIYINIYIYIYIYMYIYMAPTCSCDSNPLTRPSYFFRSRIGGDLAEIRTTGGR